MELSCEQEAVFTPFYIFFIFYDIKNKKNVKIINNSFFICKSI